MFFHNHDHGALLFLTNQFFELFLNYNRRSWELSSSIRLKPWPSLILTPTPCRNLCNRAPGLNFLKFLASGAPTPGASSALTACSTKGTIGFFSSSAPALIAQVSEP